MQQVGEPRVVFVQSLLAKGLHTRIRMSEQVWLATLWNCESSAPGPCLLPPLHWSSLKLRAGVDLGHPHHGHISPLTYRNPTVAKRQRHTRSPVRSMLYPLACPERDLASPRALMTVENLRPCLLSSPMGHSPPNSQLSPFTSTNHAGSHSGIQYKVSYPEPRSGQRVL